MESRPHYFIGDYRKLKKDGIGCLTATRYSNKSVLKLLKWLKNFKLGTHMQARSAFISKTYSFPF